MKPKFEFAMTKKQIRLLNQALELKNSAKSLYCPTCVDYGGNAACKTCNGLGTVWVLRHDRFGKLGQKIVEAMHAK